MLAYAEFRKPFILHTDASIEGLEAVLYQEHGGLEKVVAYGSRGLQKGIIQPTNLNFYVSNGLPPTNSMIICMETHFLFIQITTH